MCSLSLNLRLPLRQSARTFPSSGVSCIHDRLECWKWTPVSRSLTHIRHADRHALTRPSPRAAHQRSVRQAFLPVAQFCFKRMTLMFYFPRSGVSFFEVLPRITVFCCLFSFLAVVFASYLPGAPLVPRYYIFSLYKELLTRIEVLCDLI